MQLLVQDLNDRQKMKSIITIVEIHLTFIDKSLSITYFAKTFLTDSGRASLSSITSPSTKVKAHMSIKRWNTKQTHHIIKIMDLMK